MIPSQMKLVDTVEKSEAVEDQDYSIPEKRQRIAVSDGLEPSTVAPCSIRQSANGSCSVELAASSHPETKSEICDLEKSSLPVDSEDDDDDDWGDAAWDVVPKAKNSAQVSRTSASGGGTNSLSKESGHAPPASECPVDSSTIRSSDASHWAASKVSSVEHEMGNPKLSSRINGASNPYLDKVRLQAEEEGFNMDEVSDLEDLSELEDEEPVCTDLIVAQFESVQRPHARKPTHKGLWRIKLKHGVMQINGQEILFNTMAGEFHF